MPQISISVSQEDYNMAMENAKRYGDVSLANVVRKMVTCYAKRVVFFNNRIPEIDPAKLDDFIAEIYGAKEAPEPEAPVIEKKAPRESAVTELTDGMTFGQLQSYYPDGSKPMSLEFMEALEQAETPDWTWSAAQHKWLAPKKKGVA